MMKKQFSTLLVFVLSATLLSCTRKVDESSRVSLNLSSNLNGVSEAASSLVAPGYYPSHVIANIHYDNQTATADWDCPVKETNILLCTLPPVIDFGNRTFPNGRGRIVQVLLVYEDELGNMQFFYDHALDQTFNGASKVIPLNHWLSAGASTGMGRVAGRLLHAGSDSNGPTGTAVGSYDPNGLVGVSGTNLPTLQIFRAPIISGWFKFDFIQGNPFTYNLIGLDGVNYGTLFKAKKLEDFTAAASTANKVVTHISQPEFYSVFSDGSGQFRSMHREAQDFVIGFFDMDTAGEIVLRDTCTSCSNTKAGLAVPASTPIAYAYRSTVGPTPGVLVNPLLNPTTWANPTNPTVAASPNDSTSWNGKELQYNNTASGSGIVIPHGLAASTSNCSAGQSDGVMGNCIRVLPEAAANNSLVPFMAPFQQWLGAHGYQGLDVSYASNVYTLTWKYLPDLSAQVAGASVFSVPSLQIPHDDEKFPCDALARGEFGAVEHADVAYPNSTATILESNLRVPTSMYSPIVCPYSMMTGAKKYFPVGLRAGGFFNAGVSGTLSVAGTTPFNEASCVSYSVIRSNASDPAVSVHLSSTLPDMKFYADPICSNPLPGGTLTIPASTANAPFYVKTLAVMTSTSAQIMANASGYTTGNYPVMINDIGKLIFMSSNSYPAYNLNGYSSANSICMNLAVGQTSVPLKALISSNQDLTQMPLSSDLYYRADGATVGYVGNISQALMNHYAMELNQNIPAGVNTYVWSGFTWDGIGAMEGGTDNCQNWVSMNNTDFGSLGNAKDTTASRNRFDYSSLDCSTTNAQLICYEP